jgi:leucyl aminopeptidase
MNIYIKEQKFNDINGDLELIFLSSKQNDYTFNVETKKIVLNLNSFKKENIRYILSKAIREIKNYSFKSLKLSLVQKKKELDLSLLVDTFLLSDYEFLKYKSKEKKQLDIYISTFNSTEDFQTLEQTVRERIIVSSSVNYVRDIVNTPPQDYTPFTMAKDAKELSKDENITCKIYDEEELEELSLNAILAVSRASVNEAKLIHLKYKPKAAKKKIVLLGKGVTYDTGGLSLKRGDGMVSMKCDKAGASLVLGIIKAVSQLKLNIEVHGVLGAAENMIGNDAFKPDDVIKIANKHYVEITNTDAEGRLVLADCFYFANTKIKDFDYILDFATLTGASIGAFGGFTGAILGYNQKLRAKIEKASKKSGELTGYMPFNIYMQDRLKSGVADFVNSPKDKTAAAIVGAMFLEKFVEDKNKWFHFDIAGPSYRKQVWAENPYGASGYGLRLMIEFLKDYEKRV